MHNIMNRHCIEVKDYYMSFVQFSCEPRRRPLTHTIQNQAVFKSEIPIYFK